MQWLSGNYKPLHFGAFGGTSDPAGWELYTGGQYPTWRQIMKPHEVNGADFEAANHVFRQVPALGLGASLRPEIRGVPANDRTHILSLDGHLDSAISNHQDGRYAQNTAATTDYSLGANSAYLMGPGLPPGGLLQVGVPDRDFEASSITRYSDGYSTARGRGPMTASQLSAQRTRNTHGFGKYADTPRSEQPDLLTLKADGYGSRVLSVLQREWSAPELGLGAMGLYMAYSVVA